MTEAPIIKKLTRLMCEGYEIPAGYGPEGYAQALQKVIDLARADAAKVEIMIRDKQRYKARIAELEAVLEEAREWIDGEILITDEYELDNTKVMTAIARALNLERSNPDE